MLPARNIVAPMFQVPTKTPAARSAVLVVDDERRLIGALNMHDLFRAKVI